MTEWRETTLGDFSPLRYGANLPSASRKNGDVPVVSSAGFIDKHDEALVNCAGLVIGRKGTVGSVTLVEQPFWPIDTTFYVADDPTERDLRFAYYLLSSLGLNQMNSDSAVPGLNRENAHAVRFKCPPLPEQRAIAGVLGVLDDKIAANRAMNDTLEKMARAIFTDWFVDFGPTRAKMTGDAPYLAPEIWDLFPDTIDPTTTLPTGWEMFSVNSLATHVTTSIVPSAHEDEIFAHHSIPAFDVNGQPILQRGGEIKSNKTLVPVDGVLLSKLNPSFNRVWLTHVSDSHRAICSTEFLVFTPKAISSTTLLFLLFKSENFRAQLFGAVSGTSNSHQRVAPSTIKGMMALAGNEKLYEAFAEVTEPLMEMVQHQKDEIQTLAKMRDLLLSPLMSGKLRVATADNHPAPKLAPKPDDPPAPTQQPEDRDG